MAIIVLGNTAPIEAVKVDETSTDVRRVPRPDLAPTVTTFQTDPSLSAVELVQLASVYRSHHSDEHPAWIESDDANVARILAAVFDCPIGNPDLPIEQTPVAPKRTRKS